MSQNTIVQAVQNSALAPELLLFDPTRSTDVVTSDVEQRQLSDEDITLAKGQDKKGALVQHLRDQSSALKQIHGNNRPQKPLAGGTDAMKGVTRPSDGPEDLSKFEFQKFRQPRVPASNLSGTSNDKSTAAGLPACAAMSNIDGRWRSVQCESSLPAACKSVLPFASEDTSFSNSSGDQTLKDTNQQVEYVNGTTSVNLRPQWVLGSEVVFSMESGWEVVSRSRVSNSNDVPDNPVLRHGHKNLMHSTDTVKGMEALSGVQCQGCCPYGYVFVYPQSGWDNLQLWVSLNLSGKARVMLPIIPGVVR